jgi:hypothetical protein
MQIPVFTVKDIGGSQEFPRGNPATFAAPGQALAAGGEAVSREASSIVGRIAEARIAAESGTLLAGAVKDLGERQFEWSKNPDSTAAYEGYQKDAAAIRTRVLDGVSHPVMQSYLQRNLDHAIATGALHTRQQSFRVEASARSGELLQNLSNWAEAMAGAASEGQRQQYFDLAKADIQRHVDAGWISPEEGARARLRFQSQGQEVAAIRELGTNPSRLAQRLADPAQFQGMDPERRAVLLTRAQDRADAQSYRAQARAEHAERMAQARGRQFGDQQLNDLYVRAERARNGQGEMPTLDEVHRLRDVISPGEMSAVLGTLRRSDAPVDRADTLRALTVEVDRLDPDEFERRAGQALQRGELRVETYRSLTTQNRTARRDDEPASAYRSGRAFVSDALDPGNVVGGQFMRGPLATARQNGLADYDAWAKANPTATREGAIATARRIVETYQTMATSESRNTVGRPWGYRGGLDGITEETVRQAAQMLSRDAREGRIGGVDLVRETERLDAWQQILRTQPAKPAGGSSSGRGGGVQTK